MIQIEESLVVLEPYFVVVQQNFCDYGLERCARVKLWCAPWVHDTERHFAACTEDGQSIYAAPELADLPENTVLAIMAHEFGHATDFLYPAEFAMGQEGAAVRRPLERSSDKQVRQWLNGWKSRDDDQVEMSADAIAELVLGMPIGYRGPCQLQCFNCGSGRPAGLR